MAPIIWIWSFFSGFLPVKRNVVTRTILQKYISVQQFRRCHQLISPTRSSGVLKPREMCLVLGCPGSGCSTFLKTIANQRDGYARVSGDVLYAGIDSDEMLKYYKGEVVYNQEGLFQIDEYQSPLWRIKPIADDIHIATLTVAQTLAFALSTCVLIPVGVHDTNLYDAGKPLAPTVDYKASPVKILTPKFLIPYFECWISLIRSQLWSAMNLSAVCQVVNASVSVLQKWWPPVHEFNVGIIQHEAWMRPLPLTL